MSARERDWIAVAEIANALQTSMDKAEQLLDEAEAMREYVMCPACEQPVSEHTEDTLYEHTNGVLDCQITMERMQS